MKRILVTRPVTQNASLVEALQGRGDMPLVYPLLMIEPYNESECSQACEAIKSKVQRLAEFNSLIFISTNAVEAGWSWIDRYWPQLPTKQHWFAIGEATAAVLRRHDISVESGGNNMNSEALLQHPDLQDLSGQKVMIFRGAGGREYLREMLEQRGALVEYCEVYQRKPVSHAAGELASLLEGGIDVLTVTSAESLQLLLEEAANDGIKADIQKLPLIVPGERVATLARERGFRQVIKARNAGVAAFIETLENQCKQESIAKNPV